MFWVGLTARVTSLSLCDRKLSLFFLRYDNRHGMVSYAKQKIASAIFRSEVKKSLWRVWLQFSRENGGSPPYQPWLVRRVSSITSTPSISAVPPPTNPPLAPPAPPACPNLTPSPTFPRIPPPLIPPPPPHVHNSEIRTPATRSETLPPRRPPPPPPRRLERAAEKRLLQPQTFPPLPSAAPWGP